MSLPGCAAIPAPYGERAQIAYDTGRRIVDMVHEDLTPDRILTREAFENAIVVNSAIGGSTNCPPHITAIARHIGVPLDIEDWENVGHRHSAAGQRAARGRVSGRRLPSRRRRAGDLLRTARRGQDSYRRAHRDRQDGRRKLRELAQSWITNVIRPYDKPLQGERRLPGGRRAICSTRR